MCQFCAQHGEGNKWYLQAKNYARELVNDERLGWLRGYLLAPHPLARVEEQLAAQPVEALATLFNQGQPVGDAAEFKAQVRERMLRDHYGQVVPLEDAEAILDHTVSVARVACVCRSMLLGKRDARFCYGFVGFDADWWPKKGEPPRPEFSSDLEVLTPEEAKRAMRAHDREGLVHGVYTFITPFVGAICNCTNRDCIALRSRAELDLALFFKGEYVAQIDQEACTGCRDCLGMCNFGAVTYSRSLERCSVNPFGCFGCGVCRAGCASGAITLVDRAALPAVAQDW
jgi:ferredoxin